MWGPYGRLPVHPMLRMAELTRLSMQMSLMLVEAQMVIALRTLGMMGAMPARPDEALRMVTEKAAAYSVATQAAGRAMLAGKEPDEIALAALRPIRRRTRANASRLSSPRKIR